ncbi:MAG: hypothetical protein LBE27_07920 [Deltaproteobacteria bacterium]|jgi:hypothetical protein|nr:hypothetical protein [Deltaproteobacteria bacterium]
MNNSYFFRNISSFNTIIAAILKTSMLIVLLSFFTFGGDSQAMASPTAEPKYYTQCYKPISKYEKEINAKSASTDQGGLKGALNELQSKNADERFASYSKYLDDDYERISKAMDSLVESSNCYSQANKQLSTDFEAGKIPEKESDARKAAIMSGVDVCKQILTHYSDLAETNIEQYDEVLKTESSRTTDKPSAQIIEDFNNKLTKLKNTKADIFILSSDLEIMNSGNLLDMLF